MNEFGFINSSISLVVSRTTVRLHRVVLLVDNTGGDITIYEGLDATSGRKIATLKGLANVSLPVDFGGIQCSRGLYVDVGDNVIEYTVIYDYVPVAV